MVINIFKKHQVPETLPLTLEYQVEKLKSIEDKEEFVKQVYSLLTQRYYGSKIKTVLLLFDLFRDSIDSIWKRPGFMHCTNINKVFRAIMLKSHKIRDSEIKLKISFLYFIIPHQYVSVKLNDTWINIDIWAYAYNIEFGDYARGFHV